MQGPLTYFIPHSWVASRGIKSTPLGDRWCPWGHSVSLFLGIRKARTKTCHDRLDFLPCFSVVCHSKHPGLWQSCCQGRGIPHWKMCCWNLGHKKGTRWMVSAEFTLRRSSESHLRFFRISLVLLQCSPWLTPVGSQVEGAKSHSPPGWGLPMGKTLGEQGISQGTCYEACGLFPCMLSRSEVNLHSRTVFSFFFFNLSSRIHVHLALHHPPCWRNTLYPIKQLLRNSGLPDRPWVSNRDELGTHSMNDWSVGAARSPLRSSLKRMSQSSSIPIHLRHKKWMMPSPQTTLYSLWARSIVCKAPWRKRQGK